MMSKSKKIVLDDFYLRLLIKGLYETLDNVPAESKTDVSKFILKLTDIEKSLKSNRKVRLSFDSMQRSYIIQSLVSWHNKIIANNGPSEYVDSLLFKFSK